MHRTIHTLKGLVRLTLLPAIGFCFASTAASQVPPPPAFPGEPAPAQTPDYPSCQPPSSGEYLLLVKSHTVESQNQVRRALPASARSNVCNYLDDVVTRVSGFTNIDTANAWARYLNESVGLSAFVARPSESAANMSSSSAPGSVTSSQPAGADQAIPGSSSSNTPTQSVAASRLPPRFNPRPLGVGYAVLVNYFNRPELAVQVYQLLGTEVGLVSYGQRPYLLAIHTADQVAANATLQKLTDRGFLAMVVDSRRVTLLRQAVNLQQPTAQN